MSAPLSYSNPAIEPLPVPPGPPDPPIPPGLLVDASRRRLIPKKTMWWQVVASVLGLTVVVILLPVYSAFELCVFCFVPTTPAVVLTAHTDRSDHTNQISFQYKSAGVMQTDTVDVSDAFFASVHLHQQVRVHAIVLGRWNYSQLDVPSLDFAAARWWRWLLSAAVALLIWVKIRIRSNPKKLEETVEGLIGLHGVPMIARLIKKGAKSFTVSTGKVTYQYILPNGRAVKTTVGTEFVPCLARKRPGDPFIVLCDADEPEFHRLYDSLPFTVEVDSPAG